MTEINRLYNKFQPNRYDIYLDINRKTEKITGKTIIFGNAKSKNISIHQKGLNILKSQINDEKIAFKNDNKKEIFNINLPKTGKTTLTIDYTAPLTNSMMGIYPSYYKVNGIQKQIIGTQFESTAARQAFPCIDEPEAKAKFNLAIKFDEHPGEIIISNTPETRKKNGIHYFATTTKMSTYLIAFAFGELQSVKTKTKSGVKIGVFATKAHKNKELRFALDIAKRSIEFYEKFYQIPYPLKHSWQLALPDFSAGAMENWGLVTYREAYLLLDPDNTSLKNKQLIATVIAHELAHQWFGDLVTMKWWDDLWLNESFANMMEYVAIDALQPDWHIWEMFQTSDVPAALQRDAIDGVQPVHVHVENPAEIDSIFDPAIVYAKGARMLVMVRALLGDKDLRNGLKNYFVAHRYGNATGSDLWKALSTASGKDIGTVMKTWLDQPGYPLVTAIMSEDKLKLSQQQFFLGQGKETGRKWQIPLNSNYKSVPTIMTKKTEQIGNYVKLYTKANKPFRLNVNNNSHFIVKYDQNLLKNILKNSNLLDPISQLQILQDQHLLAEAGKIPYASIVSLLTSFSDSHSNIVNAALYRIANNLKIFIKPNSYEEKNLQTFFNKLSINQINRLGWQAKKGESSEDQLTRPYILKASLYGKNSNTIQTGHNLFQSNKNKIEALPANIRRQVLINEVKNFGKKELFDQLLEDYHQTSNNSYKNDICQALTNATNQNLLNHLIKNFKNSNLIKPQDLRSWFFGVLDNSKGEQLAWDWIRNNWQWLEDTVGGDMEFVSYISVIGNVFHTKKRLTEFKDFFKPKINMPSLKREIKMDAKAIENRFKLVKNEKQTVNKTIEELIK